MATLNMSKIMLEATQEWQAECVARMAASFKDDPRAARRGVPGMLEPPQDAKGKRDARTLLQQLGESDPSGMAFEQGLTERINATSFQEVMAMLRPRLNTGGQ